MPRLPIALALVVGAGFCSFTALQAQDGPPPVPGQMDVSRVESGTYATDPNHSLVGWRVSHFGFNDYFGLFGDAAGTLVLDADNIENSTVEITVPIDSVVTVSAALVAHLLQPGQDGGPPDFFGADPAPATFTSTSIESTGGTTANITGDLTINGQTHPVTIAAEFTGAGDHPSKHVKTVGFEGHAVIDRTQFGISAFAPLISSEVELDITVAFEKQ